MTATSQTWTDEIVEAAGAKIQLIKGGTGEPVLVLHDEMGHPGWLRAYESLARQHTVHIPLQPGFGKSERLDWMMTVRDLAVWYLQALGDLGLARVNVVGFSMGAWLAAEMAAMCRHQFNRMVLVSAMGVRPPTGEIYDMFVVTAKEFLEASFHDPANTPEYQALYSGDPSPEERERRESAREQACRLSWRPYMHDLALPQLLPGIKDVPTLIVWGKGDAIVPVSAGEAYRDAIPGSRLIVLDNCGHHPEIEQTDRFVSLVNEFLA